jgi:hypothetical protein
VLKEKLLLLQGLAILQMIKAGKFVTHICDDPNAHDGKQTTLFFKGGKPPASALIGANKLLYTGSIS